MWNDLVNTLSTKISALGDWIADGKAFIYYCLPLAALVYFVVKQLKKPRGDRRD
jgi:hypothetical protein